jgi:hypothetical protein
MDYDLTRLGASQFESLLSALVREMFGSTLGSFTKGEHGGREAFFAERVAWPTSAGGHVWSGQIILQVHFRQDASTHLSDYSWFLQSIHDTFKRWVEDARSRIARNLSWRRIDYLLLITNAKLPEPERAAADEAAQEYCKQLGIKGCITWTFNDLALWLDRLEEVRKEFFGFIASGNALMHISEYLPGVDLALSKIMAREIATELPADQWVRLTQAGDRTHEKLALNRVAIDLPLLDGKIMAVNYILRESNRRLRGSPNHIVLLGGPGQGKTTIGQLVCQIYRTALLSDAQWLGGEGSSLQNSTRDGLAHVGIPMPTYWRWPVRVELSSFADSAMSASRMSLLRCIAEKVGLQTSDQLDAAGMRPWLQNFPWLLVLDGLDEVASATARDTLMERISAFLVEVEMAGADLLMIVTTRPQGYVGELDSAHYNHITLDSLTPLQATEYAKKLAEVRHSDDPEMRRKLIGRTAIAANEESTARLMRSPLQVTIMSLLLEGRERAPQARYDLFEAYYETIYARESGKPGDIRRLLEQQRSHINALHDRVGLLLQVKGEKAGGADASIPKPELRDLALERLLAEGFLEKRAADLADQIVNAVTDRLVLLVPKFVDDLGFEVRSIQEFMAARAIVSGTDESVLKKLRITAPLTHWRNTWLLAAGRLFALREHLRLSLLALLAEIDASGMVAMVVASGADLALDLLDDDITATTPRLQRMLVNHALTLLNYPPDQDLQRRALALFRSANQDPIARTSIITAIDQALRATPARAKSARIVCQVWRNQKGLLADSARTLATRGDFTSKAGVSRALVDELRQKERPSMADLVRPNITNAKLTKAQRAKAEKLLDDMAGVPLLVDRVDLERSSGLASRMTANRSVVEGSLKYPAVADAIATAALDTANISWFGASELRNLLRSWVQRQSVGEYLIATTSFQDMPEV